MSEQLISLADEGEARSEDDGCLMLFARVRDCAYTMHAQAQFEREAHLAEGVWDDSAKRGIDGTAPNETKECG